jgi:hypothetical protein
MKIVVAVPLQLALNQIGKKIASGVRFAAVAAFGGCAVTQPASVLTAWHYAEQVGGVLAITVAMVVVYRNWNALLTLALKHLNIELERSRRQTKARDAQLKRLWKNLFGS